ncbi:MAG: MgtC/SapB family protein [Ignavibacteria bacterium]|jgi:putative Mg2+ transporter-C (MgtC) family protein|nr:MgtC/SapB family protein [Ignavibacteria bacterium]MCU7503583.1 MgtC/SapB family protein [Ignavibacteria bacterium]MCU7516763.1 MgtC/SapB family protein [Ignavibacteria bacterium]
MEYINEFGILYELLLSLLLGGIIGFEREMAHKAAGLRTHMLVAGVSTFFVAMGDSILISYKLHGFGDLIRADPFRVIGAIVTGLSFIGAGTIIQNKKLDRIEGLTTAASLLFVGAIGIAVALQKFILAAGSTLIVLVVNRGIMFIEKKISFRKTDEHPEA